METGSGGGFPGPRGGDLALSQRRFTHREFLNEDEERDGQGRPAETAERVGQGAGGKH